MVNKADAQSIALDAAVFAGVQAVRGKPINARTVGSVALASTVYEYALDKVFEDQTRSMIPEANASVENTVRLSKVVGQGLSHYAITYFTGQSTNAMESFYVGLTTIASDEIGSRVLGVKPSNFNTQ